MVGVILVPELLSEVIIGRAVNQDVFDGLYILAVVAQGTVNNSNTVKIGLKANFTCM